MNILVGYGTRPEYIKLSPCIQELKSHFPVKTLRVLQHTDLVTEESDFSVKIPEGQIRLDAILSSINLIDSKVFEGITHVMVQGDTHSALALALSAYHRGVKIIHLEAGLRTYDRLNPYPEEGTRQIIARISDINLCPTLGNLRNLTSEKAPGLGFVVGNTGLDNLLNTRSGATYSNQVFITLHRRENHPRIPEWFEALDEMAFLHPHLELILPIHPNPNVYRHRGLLKSVKVVEPIIYADFKNALMTARYFITDSGGIQEEAAFLGKKCIILRKTTERPEVIPLGSMLCHEPKDLNIHLDWVEKNYKGEPSDVFGDGRSSINVVRILKELSIS